MPSRAIVRFAQFNAYTQSSGQTQWERPEPVLKLQDEMQNSQISNNYQGSMHEESTVSNDYEGSFQDESNTSNNYEGSTQTDMESESSNIRNSYERDIGNNNVPTDFDGSEKNSNICNNFDESTEASNASNAYDSVQQSNQRDGSVSNMSSTYESSSTSSGTCDVVSDVMPPGWIALKDHSGEVYYANEATGESSWTKPMMTQSTQEEMSSDKSSGNSADQSVDGTVDDINDENLPPNWIALKDKDSGDTYYLNEDTMETTWDKPSPENDRSETGSYQDSEQTSENNTVDDIVNDDDNLPPGWETILDPTTGDYYYAHENGETSWDRPASDSTKNGNDRNNASQGPIEDNEDSETSLNDNLPSGWFSAVDKDSGDRYYCNEDTGETAWEHPTENSGDENVRDPGSGDSYYDHEESSETSWDRLAEAKTRKHSNELSMSGLSISDNLK